MHTVRAGGIPGIAHKDLAAQIGAGGQHHALCGVLAVELGNDALHMALLHLKAHYLGLMDGKAGGKLQCVLHVFVVAFAVGLHPQCVHRRALALVQHPTLQVGGIRRQTHHTAKGIQFTHQRSFCSATDAGIAGHIADGVQTHGKHGGPGAQCGGGVGRFDAGMPGTNDDHIIIS